MNMETVALRHPRLWDKGGRKVWRSGTVKTMCVKPRVSSVSGASHFCLFSRLMSVSAELGLVCYDGCLNFLALRKKTALSTRVQVWACVSVQEHAC